MKSGATIVVGMSGGVDSSVAALLLKRQGYRVIGVFMKNWQEDPATAGESACSAEEDYDDVRRVCDRLDIPYYSVGFEEEYRRQVFASFVADYEAGFTPNPDVLCNREIKFNLFLKKAFELGAEALATGHYCRTEGGRLLRAADPSKDQSYFVHTLSKAILGNVLFPIGQLLKTEVRELAREAGLATHGKKDSTGICFIGERDFKTFLGRYVALRPGALKRLDGTVVGQHSGAAYYTMGQRRGLGLGGEGARWFVVGKDVAANVVYVERGDDHPALYSGGLTANEASWVAGAAPATKLRCTAKIRYRQPDQACEVRTLEDGRLSVVFDEPQRAIAPRQAVVFYDGEVCLGGAMIEAASPSYHAQGKTISDRCLS